jgi:hypothetical protein
LIEALPFMSGHAQAHFGPRFPSKVCDRPILGIFKNRWESTESVYRDISRIMLSDQCIC